MELSRTKIEEIRGSVHQYSDKTRNYYSLQVDAASDNLTPDVKLSENAVGNDGIGPTSEHKLDSSSLPSALRPPTPPPATVECTVCSDEFKVTSPEWVR